MKQIKTNKKIFGQELILDLYDCNPKVIRSKNKLKEYVDKLCRLMRMKKFGKTIVLKFGFGADFTAGYSLTQFIETGLISGHFSELWNTAHINIFSCKKFNSDKAAIFSKRFFGAKLMKKRVLIR